jgi:nitrous oxidase accessory protein NosD
MASWRREGQDRRDFLAAAAGLAATGARWAWAGERPPVTNPRATSGDTVEPDWNERLTVTVGPREADLVGSTDRVLQAAVDYAARLGGGTVRILPGTYRLRNAVYLPSRVRLLGSGADTVLIKEASQTVKLAVDSDWYDQEITLADAKGFRVGDGVCLRARNPDTRGNVVLKRTLVARSGNRFKLDRPLRENLWLQGEATVSTLFPLLSGDNITDIVIEDLTLDGNKRNNENLDGNYAGCIFLQDCSRATLRKVTARHYNGDGISWQICHDVRVEDCHSLDHTGLGLHPGSGSQRPIIRNNKLRGNDIGLFFCWGVKFGLAEKNRIEDSRSYGISIGHRDTDNLLRENEVVRSGKVGVLFRPERGKAFAPHRNRLEKNRILDSGPANGIAIDVQGETESITLLGNQLRETRQPMDRIAIRVGAQTRDIRLTDNQFDGFSVTLADLRKR